MLCYIVKGKEEGVCVLCGGDVLKGDDFDNGVWVVLIVFIDCSDDMIIVCEEIFGLVMFILIYELEDEVICCVNDIDYGLVVGIVMVDLNCVYCVIY